MYTFSHVVCYTFVLYMMLAVGYKIVPGLIRVAIKLFLASSEWLAKSALCSGTFRRRQA